MRVELIHGMDNPEEIVCRAARNDYRGHGVMPDEFSFEEIMAPIEASPAIIEDLLESDIPTRFSEEAFRKRDDVGEDDDLGERWLELFGGEGRDREIEAKKRTLMDHLIRSGHWGPFEHPQAVVHLKGVTRVLMAQITRHRHASFDIMSLRYVGLEDEDLDDIEDRFQIPQCVKEGSYTGRGGVVEISDEAEQTFINAYRHAIGYYRNLLDQGVPQEEARKVLPMGTKVNIVVSMNARAWMHILSVRQKPNVQGETKRAADRIFEELSDWMPYAFERFEEKKPMELAP